MNDIATFFAIALGIVVAIAYTLLLGWYRKAFPQTAAPGLPGWVKKYGLLLLLSLVAAFIILVGYRAANPTVTISFYTAVLLGFGWEASVEKLLNPPKA